METRAALCTTRLSAITVSAPTAVMAILIFQRTPVRRAGRLTCPSRLQLVADATGGLDPVLPYLGAKALDMDVHPPGVAAPAVVPDPLKELVAGQYGAGRR